MKADAQTHQGMRTCDDGCNGCNDCTDYYCGDEYGDEPHGPPEFGCCLPLGECCMPGLHFPSECHTAADYERAHPLDWRRADEVRADWEAELRRDAFGA